PATLCILAKGILVYTSDKLNQSSQHVHIAYVLTRDITNLQLFNYTLNVTGNTFETNVKFTGINVIRVNLILINDETIRNNLTNVYNVRIEKECDDILKFINCVGQPRIEESVMIRRKLDHLHGVTTMKIGHSLKTNNLLIVRNSDQPLNRVSTVTKFRLKHLRGFLLGKCDLILSDNDLI